MLNPADFFPECKDPAAKLSIMYAGVLDSGKQHFLVLILVGQEMKRMKDVAIGANCIGILAEQEA